MLRTIPNPRIRIMSWWIRYESTQDYTGDVRAPGSAKDEDLSAEAKEQVDLALKTANAVIAHAAIGGREKDYAVSLSGHANPGHAPTSGYANDCITVTVSQKS